MQVNRNLKTSGNEWTNVASNKKSAEYYFRIKFVSVSEEYKMTSGREQGEKEAAACKFINTRQLALNPRQTWNKRTGVTHTWFKSFLH